jgi:hypothetical protein
MNSEVINPVLSIKQEICEIIYINATLCFRLRFNQQIVPL